jgi:Spy/CpxP family protein refolding chaperone
MKPLFITILLFLWISFAGATSSPYVGEEHRVIKSLSQDEIQGLKNGKGLGFAKVAELNRYPGPRHVLDLENELNLSDKQVQVTKAIFDQMQADAIHLGHILVNREKSLDTLFATEQISQDKLESMLSAIGQTRAELRGVHLNAHLELKQVLTSHQIVLYDKLRGYSNWMPHKSHSH